MSSAPRRATEILDQINEEEKEQEPGDQDASKPDLFGGNYELAKVSEDANSVVEEYERDKESKIIEAYAQNKLLSNV